VTVLDKIKVLFRRSKPVAKVGEERPPDVMEEKPLQVAREKLDETTEPQKDTGSR